MDYEKIIADLGGTVEVAKLCECSPQAVSQWFGVDPETGEQRRIPNARLLYLKAVRPDVFPGFCKKPTRKAKAPA
jgi:hypothetical protein